MRSLTRFLKDVFKITILFTFAVLLLWLIGRQSGKVYAVYLPPKPYLVGVELIEKVAQSQKLNGIIIDYEDPLRENLLKFSKGKGLYTIVRMVVFPEGASWEQLNDQQLILEIFSKAEELTKSEYTDEIQLDYIRFKDDQIRDTLKGEYIAKLVTHIRKVNLWKKLSIDIFGRVAEGEDDIVGQSIVRLEKHIDIVSPMLYPSHYGLQQEKRRDPYGTVYEGVLKVKRQLNNPGVTVRPYLQAFDLKLEGLVLPEYIKQQILAAEAVAYGYCFWNGEGKYEPVFQVLSEMGF